MTKYILYINFLCLFIGCAPEKKQDDVNVVAHAGEKELSLDEYKKLHLIPGSSKDSLAVADKLIARWAEDELFYQEAKDKLLPEDMDIEAEVRKYTQDLINYKYEVKLIENNLDTSVSKEEIMAYYDANRENFILKDNIVKVNYFKIPTGTKVLDKIKKCIVSVNPKDKEQLKSLCIQYAENYFINDSTWLLLEDVKKEIPQLRELPEYSFMTGRVFEYTDSLNYFYLKIKDVKIKNAMSPINFEQNNIRNIILNKRKTKLIRQYKQQIFEKAKTDGVFKKLR